MGCGRIASKVELVRIAAIRDSPRSGARAVADADMTMPGRGAYLCRAEGATAPTEECLALAMRRGGIARALRSAVTLDPKLVESVGR